MKEKIKIIVTEPCVIGGKDVAIGSQPTVSARDARYLIGLGKAVAAEADEPKKRGRRSSGASATAADAGGEGGSGEGETEE
ncbi:MAG: hypothetical protein LBI35_07215 [Burkholderiales bacterium]|jgi:hypothetical protein|nr:hypothetical protein [Burkholderiales bacterium]